MVDLNDQIVRARALAQTHAFSPRCYRYVNRTVERQREEQSEPELGIWAGHALTAGYCLRSVEESDTGASPAADGADLPHSLDEASTVIAGRIRTEGAEAYLIYEEERVVTALDRMIEGEIERRLWAVKGQLDEATQEQLEEYLTWWVVKGYALRVADQLLPAEVESAPGSDASADGPPGGRGAAAGPGDAGDADTAGGGAGDGTGGEAAG